MISLSATTFDLSGRLILPVRAVNAWQASRRGTVTATLDGGCSVYDTGYSVSDITMTANVRHPTKTQITTLQYLVAYYSRLILCCESGAFEARVQFTVRNEILSLQMRLLSRLDA